MVANTPRTTRRAIKSLARMPSFSARSFTEIPSVIVMFARDRRRLVADDHARRRSVALHRAFLHASRHISLSRPSRRSAWTRSRTRLVPAAPCSCSRAHAQRTRSRRRNARRMHRTSFSRTQRRARRSRRGRSARCAEKLVVPEQVVPALAEKARSGCSQPEAAMELCIPDAAPFAA